MREKIINFRKSRRKGKKYEVTVEDLKTRRQRKIHFGASDYEQFKDSTPLKLYAHKNHGTIKRRRNYFNRHSGTPHKGKAIDLEKKRSNRRYTAKILSHIYLW